MHNCQLTTVCPKTTDRWLYWRRYLVVQETYSILRFLTPSKALRWRRSSLFPFKYLKNKTEPNKCNFATRSCNKLRHQTHWSINARSYPCPVCEPPYLFGFISEEFLARDTSGRTIQVLHHSKKISLLLLILRRLYMMRIQSNVCGVTETFLGGIPPSRRNIYVYFKKMPLYSRKRLINGRNSIVLHRLVYI